MITEIITVIVIILIAAISAIIGFIALPNSKKIANIKEWLKYAVIEAEKELGSGTGQLKLHKVYDMAVNNFPFIIKLIPFDTFSEWVDETLEWMRQQLSDNKAAQNYVESK